VKHLKSAGCANRKRNVVCCTRTVKYNCVLVLVKVFVYETFTDEVMESLSKQPVSVK